MDRSWSTLKNLVLVAGHAVYIGSDFNNPDCDSNWCLQSFQAGEPPFYVQHIRRAVELTAADPDTLLVFSGGQTRADAGPLSEAQSYWQIANHFRWWDCPRVKAVATTEEYARDSFQNVLFGISRFFECTQRYPERMRVVSWSFKAERFDLHRQAIAFPKDRFQFVGVNNPVDIEGALKGESKAIQGFQADPYAAQSELAKKRLARDPFRRTERYQVTCPDLSGLLQHAGPESYAGSLPWA